MKMESSKCVGENGILALQTSILKAKTSLSITLLSVRSTKLVLFLNVLKNLVQ